MADVELSHFRDLLDLKEYEKHSHVQVKQRVLGWDNAWPELLQYALRLEGPDVSEVGMTWVGSLAGMQALRAFPPQDVYRFGGSNAYVKVAWQSGMYDNLQLAIPWHLDTRVILYRRERLRKAGIDEATAFESPASILETVQKLHAHGEKIPWMVPVKEYTLQFIAPWIWRNQGHFRSEDGRQITLHEPEAFDGLLNYFKLQRYMPAELANPSLPISYQHQLFFEGKGCLFYTGNWHIFTLQSLKVDWLEDVGVVLPPGPPSVGAMYLSIWRYSIQEYAATELIRHLLRDDILHDLFVQRGFVPPRLSMLQSPPFTTDPLWKVVAQGILTGRTFKNFYRWAAVESRLASVFNQFSGDIINNHEIDLKQELHTRLLALKQRLERTILS